MKNPNADRLCSEHLNYTKALVRWQQVMESIEVYCSHDQYIGEGKRRLPPVKQLDEATLAMELAGVSVGCRYQHSMSGGALLFGPIKLRPNGENKIKVTNKHYLDWRGNVLTSKDGEPGKWLVQGEDFMEGVYFPECLSVIETLSQKV